MTTTTYLRDDHDAGAEGVKANLRNVHSVDQDPTPTQAANRQTKEADEKGALAGSSSTYVDNMVREE